VPALFQRQTTTANKPIKFTLLSAQFPSTPLSSDDTHNHLQQTNLEKQGKPHPEMIDKEEILNMDVRDQKRLG